MTNLLFYQTLTDEMKNECMYSSSDYDFSYSYQDLKEPLAIKKDKSLTILSDRLGIWRIDKDGLSIKKEIVFQKPEKLKGASGVACKNAKLSACILWTCESTSQTGIILPGENNDIDGPSECRLTFCKTFPAGVLSGELILEVVLYIKERAENVLPDEENLINEAGVTVGQLEDFVLSLKNIYMEFPVKYCDEVDAPLWWVEIKWGFNDDPEKDVMFSDGFCLYLNKHYPLCPVVSADDELLGLSNFDMLIDILAQTYFLLFTSLDRKMLHDRDELQDTIDGVNVDEGTVCGELSKFYKKCVDLDFDKPEALLKGLQTNLRRILSEEL